MQFVTSRPGPGSSQAGFRLAGKHVGVSHLLVGLPKAAETAILGLPREAQRLLVPLSPKEFAGCPCQEVAGIDAGLIMRLSTPCVRTLTVLAWLPQRLS
jgi:hypothetical protein